MTARYRRARLPFSSSRDSTALVLFDVSAVGSRLIRLCKHDSIEIESSNEHNPTFDKPQTAHLLKGGDMLNELCRGRARPLWSPVHVHRVHLYDRTSTQHGTRIAWPWVRGDGWWETTKPYVRCPATPRCRSPLGTRPLLPHPHITRWARPLLQQTLTARRG